MKSSKKETKNFQGGVCTILQRLLPIINRQLGITEVEDDSTTDATLASSDEEDDLGSGSVRVEEACQFKNGGSSFLFIRIVLQTK